MTVPLVMRRIAQREYDGAVTRYDRQRRGLGGRFVNVLRKSLERIAAQPDRYPLVLSDVREASVPKWPYCVYYRAFADHVLILAVFHTSRDPAIWQARATNAATSHCLISPER